MNILFYILNRKDLTNQVFVLDFITMRKFYTFHNLNFKQLVKNKNINFIQNIHRNKLIFLTFANWALLMFFFYIVNDHYIVADMFYLCKTQQVT